MTDIVVRLAEWQTIPPIAGSPTAGISLDNNPSARDLARRLSEAGMLEVLELRAGLSVRSTSFVGRLRLGEVEITVIPKLGFDPLLKLLRYAYGLRNLRLLPTTTHTTQPLGLQDLLVWQLVEEARELLTRGLRRSYVKREEALSSPRGRIDFRAMAGQGAFVAATLPCAYHHRDQDRLINRVLLAGLRLAATVAADRGLRIRAGRLADLLARSVSPMTLDRHIFRRLGVEMDRTTRPYEPALSLIRILYEAAGLSLSEGELRPSLPGFLFDMNRFFQALLAKFLAENLEGHAVLSEYRLKGTISYVPGFNPRGQMAPTPRPDFVVTRGEKAVAVLDAKYRDLWEHPLPRDMLYQLAIYAMIHDGATSTILYPTTHAQATEARIEVRDPLNGGRRALVILRPVSLERLERLVSLKTTAAVLRERRSFAHSVVFGAVQNRQPW